MLKLTRTSRYFEYKATAGVNHTYSLLNSEPSGAGIEATANTKHVVAPTPPRHIWVRTELKEREADVHGLASVVEFELVAWDVLVEQDNEAP